MIDHLGIEVADYARSRAFYERVLATLGYGVVMEVTRDMTGGYEGCGFGPPGRPHFWVGKGGGEPGRGAAVVFKECRIAVDLWPEPLAQDQIGAIDRQRGMQARALAADDAMRGP